MTFICPGCIRVGIAEEDATFPKSDGQTMREVYCTRDNKDLFSIFKKISSEGAC